MIQMRKEGGYVGLAEDMLRKEHVKTLEQIGNGAFSKWTKEDIQEHFMKTAIVVVAYTNTATDEKNLNKIRKSFLKVMKGINLDNIFSPNTKIEKVMFNPQLLIPIKETVPVIYEWNKNKSEFVNIP